MGEAIHDDMDGGLLHDKRHASPSMPVLYVRRRYSGTLRALHIPLLIIMAGTFRCTVLPLS